MSNKFSKEIALRKQETASNYMEAKRFMEETCSLCNKAGYCDESRCPIMRQHNLTLILLEAKAIAEKKEALGDFEVHTRHHSPESLKRMRCLRLATRVYDEAVCREASVDTLLLLDDISVQLELEEYELVIMLLEQHKAFKLANEFRKIISGGND